MMTPDIAKIRTAVANYMRTAYRCCDNCYEANDRYGEELRRLLNVPENANPARHGYDFAFRQFETNVMEDDCAF